MSFILVKQYERCWTVANITPLNYKTRVLVNSDHLAVVVLLTLGKTEKKGYWKLNVSCLKNDDVLTELKREIKIIQSLDVLTESYVELWELMKERLSYFFKYKSKILNQELNRKYETIMAEYVNLKTKSNKTEADKDNLVEMEKELAKMNDVSGGLRLQAGMDTECSTNVTKLISIHKTKLENKRVSAILNDNGQLIEDEKGKRETIRDLCKEMYKKIMINEAKLQSWLDSMDLRGVGRNAVGGEITQNEIREAISQLSKAKAPGPDGLPSELYLACTEGLVHLLTSALNDGIKLGRMHKSFYNGVISLIYKKGSSNNLDNWRHVTLMNIDYKIFAKIIVNRLNNDLENIIEKEQTCAIKGRLMWDNLAVLRDITSGEVKEEFFIINLDQRKAFDFLSREYIWDILKAYGFKKDFIDLIKILYAESTVQVNVNGVLTEAFKIERGVKQGCPLSAALYILAINPLLKRIKSDKRLSGVKTSGGERVVVLAYADDVTVIIKNEKELNIVKEHLALYEEVSGSKLNHDKTEGVWFGRRETRPNLNLKYTETMKVLGVTFCNNDSYSKNWDDKDKEIKEELDKWESKSSCFKTKIMIIKTFIVSKILFLATIFPPKEQTLKKINKTLVNFLWGTTREVTKRNLIYKSKRNGGLGAVDLGLNLKISFCKNVASGFQRSAMWIGEALSWTKKKGRARTSVPYFKVLYGDLMTVSAHLNINWLDMSSKTIYCILCDDLYGGIFPYKNLNDIQKQVCIKNILSKNISEKKRDVMWLVSVRRLAVRAVVKWSCFVTTTKCPMPNCDEDETIEHLLVECQRAQYVWGEMAQIGLNFKITNNAIMYGVFEERMSTMDQEFFWTVICTVVNKIWNTRSVMVIHQETIYGEVVFSQIKTELKRQRTLDLKQNRMRPWHLLSL